MKKTTLCLMTTCLFLTFQPLQSNNATAGVSSSVVNSNPIESTEIEILLGRLNEIKGMDKSNLKPSDKINLRIEVRSIKQRLAPIVGGGVYISVGAIILIVLLLIILF